MGAHLLVMVGQQTEPTPDELDAFAVLGFEDFTVYLDHLQPRLLASPLRPMPALGQDRGKGDISRATPLPAP